MFSMHKQGCNLLFSGSLILANWVPQTRHIQCSLGRQQVKPLMQVACNEVLLMFLSLGDG